MKVIEETVRLDEAIKVFDIIEQVLKEEKNTQAFVDISLYEELQRNGAKYHIYGANFERSFHYSDDNYNGDEKWLNHTVGGAFYETIRKASFIENCTDYMQLVQFESDGLGYTHFEQGFKQLLLIEVAK